MESQDSLVKQLAQFMVELSHLTFPAIGSIVLPQPSGPFLSPMPASSPSPPALPSLGPLTHPCFYIEGRTALSIDRGPFPTARAYFLACADRERAATRALFIQGAPAGAEYQALLAETQAIVERAVTLLIELVRRCEGLDSADPELAQYALDLHELGPKNIIVAEDDPTRIVRHLPFLEKVLLITSPFLSWRSSTGSPHPSGRCGAVRARRIGSCPRSRATMMHASNDCAACSARRWRTTQSLLVRSMRTIPATLWTRWRSTTRSAMASWSSRLYKACTFFFWWPNAPAHPCDFSR